MTENEMELINIIRENDNPTTALMTATLIVLGYLNEEQSTSKETLDPLRILD